jgi:thiamine biosynthesis lipoprotein
LERVCTRFDAQSEARRCTAIAGRWQVISPLLFETIAFGLQLAERTDGAFDPTIGQAMAQQSYNTNYVTGIRESRSVAAHTTFRDVELDAKRRAIRVAQPLVLDLNSIAKGLAIDLAALALPFPNVCIEAGGDVHVRGHNAAGQHWRVGVADPAESGALSLADCAVCTSSGVERGRHHLDGRTGQPVGPELSSVTVVAPTAVVADALSTAALVCGLDAGRNLLQAEGVQGIK